MLRADFEWPCWFPWSGKAYVIRAQTATACRAARSSIPPTSERAQRSQQRKRELCGRCFMAEHGQCKSDSCQYSRHPPAVQQQQ